MIYEVVSVSDKIRGFSLPMFVDNIDCAVRDYAGFIEQLNPLYIKDYQLVYCGVFDTDDGSFNKNINFVNDASCIIALCRNGTVYVNNSYVVRSDYGVPVSSEYINTIDSYSEVNGNVPHSV